MENIENKTLKELIQYCRDNDIKGYSKKKKEEIIDLIKKNKKDSDQNNEKNEKKEKELNAISLFSGMGGDSLAIVNSGFNLVAYSEKEKIFQETHKMNFENCKLLGNGDITKTEDEDFLKYKDNVDLIFAGFPCFVSGTKVLTNNGYKNIEDVVLTDTLMTHTGKFQNIINLQQKNYIGELYNIRIKYHSSFINCTEEHPFYTRTKNKVWNNEIKKYKYTFEKPKWKKAFELTNNDYFGMKINDNNIIPEFNFENKINKYKSELIKIKLDNPDMWFMMGYFIGDGWIEETKKTDGRNMNKIRFAINNNDIEYVFNRITKILPITDKICPSGDKCNKYGCSNFVWFNILKEFGKYAHGKLIPEWVQDAPIEFIKEFIYGYLTADGCIKKNECYSFTTVSYNLAFGLQRLYLKLGHLFSINKSIRPKTTIIEGRTVNQRDTYQIRGYIRETKRKYSSFIENGYVWYAPFKIEKTNVENEIVYNFEVENDNSYIVENTIVHNCQGFSNGGQKKKNDPRNTLFKEFVRATKLINPKYIIGENVKGLLSRKTSDNENYIDVIVKEFEDLDYDVYYKVMKAHLYGVPQKRERLIIVGIKKELNKLFEFPEELSTDVNLKNIVKFDMKGSIKIENDDFDMTTIPEECILKDMDNEEDENNPHPNLKLLAKDKDYVYKEKTYPRRLSFAKRDSSIHGEIIDIRNPAKTIICTYARQPRLFVPLQNKKGYYLRTFLPDELKQIQGFPEDYKIAGNDTKKIIQIGNAVPPPLIEIVIKSILS